MGYYTNKNDKRRIDIHLKAMASLNASLGTDSTQKERDKVTMKIAKRGEMIKNIDPDYYKEIEPDMAEYDLEMLRDEQE